MTLIRGQKPNCTACRASENAPEITACEAMMVARVARPTLGNRNHPGES